MSLLTNLVSYYKLEGLTDELAAHALVNNGTAVTHPAGKIANCAQAGDATTYLTATGSIALGTSWSISAWVRVTTQAAGLGTIASVAGSAVGLYVDPTGSKFSFYTGATTFFSTAGWSADTWRHVVLTYDGTTARWYIDGATSGSSVVAIGAFTVASIMGFQGGGLSLGDGSGRLDEVGFWTRELTGGEVTELYGAGAGSSYPFASPPPTVTSVAPSSGLETGGTSVTINGSGFVTGATVKFDGVAATSVVFVGATQLTAVTPAGYIGPADVLVTNPDTQTGTLTAGFTYLATPPVYTKYGSHLANLLPPGKLWNLEGETGLHELLVGMGDEFQRVEDRGVDLIEESDPRTADETLSDWERVLSLPDDLVTEIPGAPAARRVAITQKWVARGGANLEFYELLCASCGYPLLSLHRYQGDVLRIGFRVQALTPTNASRVFGDVYAYAVLLTLGTSTPGALTQTQFEAVIRNRTQSHIQVVFEY